jgi:hypothetical protein
MFGVKIGWNGSERTMWMVYSRRDSVGFISFSRVYLFTATRADAQAMTGTQCQHPPLMRSLLGSRVPKMAC